MKLVAYVPDRPLVMIPSKPWPVDLPLPYLPASPKDISRLMLFTKPVDNPVCSPVKIARNWGLR